MGSEAASLVAGLQSTPKTCPCSYLYDARGSALYEKIVELKEYYPYKTELHLLQKHADEIAAQIPTGAVVVELGCGSAVKTALLIQALLKRDGPEDCFFEGIDISADFLTAAKENLLGACKGLKPEHTGTICQPYLDGVREARSRHPDKVLCMLWLGSSIGNLAPGEYLAFFQDILRIGGGQTQIFLCADLWKDAEVLHAAYHDSQGVTEAFIKNGLANALRCLGLTQESPDLKQWGYHVVINAELEQVEMWLEAPEDVADLAHGVSLAKGERILMEVSRKFTQAKLRALAFQSGFFWQAAWATPLYSMQMLSAPAVALQTSWAGQDAFFGALPDWRALPISVRHPFCFYYAHMTAFAKLKMFPQEPASKWDTMFSRGMDPSVDDPSQCHDHPEVPEAWPPTDEIVAYVQQIRQKILAGVASGAVSTYDTWFAIEHDCMHLETLEYMLAQQRKHNSEERSEEGTDDSMLPGPAELSRLAQQHAQQVSIPAGPVALGVDMDTSKSFYWDNEGPRQEPCQVPAFSVDQQPVSIAQMLTFCLDPKGYASPAWWPPEEHKRFTEDGRHWPATWTIKDGHAWVHLPGGTKGWRAVAEQPAWACLEEASAFARWRGGRIMTEREYCRLLDCASDRVHGLRDGGWELTSTVFAPFEGFVAMAQYPGYSADFFDGKHYVLRGSSPVTHSSMRRDSFRNFYQGNYPFVFSKLRCCHAA